MNAVRNESAVRTDRVANDSYPNKDLTQIEGEIREFIRKDVAPLRRMPEGGSGEVFASKLNSVVQRVAGTSLQEIDNLIVELQHLREYLQQEGQRVQREVVAYAQVSQAALRSTKIIGESMATFKENSERGR